MNTDTFQKIFLRSIFRESLIDILRDIETGIASTLNEAGDKEEKKDDDNLSVEISTF